MADVDQANRARMREYLIFAGVTIGATKDKVVATGREIHLKPSPSEKNEVHGGADKTATAHITYCTIDMDK